MGLGVRLHVQVTVFAFLVTVTGEEQGLTPANPSLRGGRVVPDRREVGDQRADAGFLGLGEVGGGGVLGLVVGLAGVVESERSAVFQSASRVSATSRLAGSTAR